MARTKRKPLATYPAPPEQHQWTLVARTNHIFVGRELFESEMFRGMRRTEQSMACGRTSDGDYIEPPFSEFPLCKRCRKKRPDILPPDA